MPSRRTADVFESILRTGSLRRRLRLPLTQATRKIRRSSSLDPVRHSQGCVLFGICGRMSLSAQGCVNIARNVWLFSALWDRQSSAVGPSRSSQLDRALAVSSTSSFEFTALRSPRVKRKPVLHCCMKYFVAFAEPLWLAQNSVSQVLTPCQQWTHWSEAADLTHLYASCIKSHQVGGQ
jgi:hypothetical protein